MQLLENEKIVYEVKANKIGAVISKGGKLILTNLRLIYESSVLGLNANVELELDVNNISAYRKAYTMLVGTLLPISNAVAIITDNDTYRFTVNKRDTLFQHFKSVMPNAQQLPDETYVEGLKGVGSNVVSGISNIVGKKSTQESSQNSQPSRSTETMQITCPHCFELNFKTAKFCNSCGGKMQLECPSCNTPIERDAKFCGECGTSIKRNNQCIKCGAEYSKGQNFCNECGQKITE